MNNQELISALEALEERAKLAERKIQYSSQLQRLDKRVSEIEHKIDVIVNFIECYTKDLNHTSSKNQS